MLYRNEEESAWEIDDSNEYERHSQTWFFWPGTCVLSKDDKTFSDLLNALKKQLETSFATAS